MAEQQKTEPCFICHQLGHWSQECPYRRKEKQPHAANVTFPVSPADQQDWALLETLAVGSYMVSCSFEESTGTSSSGSPQPHSIYWSMHELNNKIIIDLGCMKTVAGTAWVNQIIQLLREKNKFVKVVHETESFRFGDGHISQSKFAVVMEITIAGIPVLLRVSVVQGNCPPLLSKPVCTSLGMIIDTQNHTLSSRRLGIKAYGLDQSAGGHYIMRVDEWPLTDRDYSIPCDFFLPMHKEVFVLPNSLGSSSDLKDWVATHGGKPSTPYGGAVRSEPERMGERRDWPGGRRGRDHGRGGRGRYGGAIQTEDTFEVSEENPDRRQTTTRSQPQEKVPNQNGNKYRRAARVCL